MKNRYVLYGIVFCVIGFSVNAYSNTSETEDPKVEKSVLKIVREKLHLNMSVSTSFEYDDNVYKSFETLGMDSDYFTRLFLNTGGYISLFDVGILKFQYQFGGKKYFNETTQDMMLNNIELSYSQRFLSTMFARLASNFKAKNERFLQDENFALFSSDLKVGNTLRELQLVSYIEAKYTYFNFTNNDAYSFHRGRYGFNVTKSMTDVVQTGLSYYFQHQHFLDRVADFDVDRVDMRNEFGGRITFNTYVHMKLGYTFQINHSNINSLDFHNHRAFVQFSKVLPLDVTLLVMAMLQLKYYPSSSDVIVDGEDLRFLRTAQEEENFNSLIVKLSKSIFEDGYIDLKYSRFSNELSTEQDEYNRNVYSIGIRVGF